MMKKKNCQSCSFFRRIRRNALALLLKIFQIAHSVLGVYYGFKIILHFENLNRLLELDNIRALKDDAERDKN